MIFCYIIIKKHLHIHILLIWLSISEKNHKNTVDKILWLALVSLFFQANGHFITFGSLCLLFSPSFSLSSGINCIVSLI